MTRAFRVLPHTATRMLKLQLMAPGDKDETDSCVPVKGTTKATQQKDLNKQKCLK